MILFLMLTPRKVETKLGRFQLGEGPLEIVKSLGTLG